MPSSLHTVMLFLFSVMLPFFNRELKAHLDRREILVLTDPKEER